MSTQAQLLSTEGIDASLDKLLEEGKGWISTVIGEGCFCNIVHDFSP